MQNTILRKRRQFFVIAVRYFADF